MFETLKVLYKYKKVASTVSYLIKKGGRIKNQATKNKVTAVSVFL